MGSKARQNRSKEWARGAWRFLISMRLGLFLLGALLLISILGSFIPQQEDTYYYFQIFGQLLAPIIFRLGLNNVFHSIGFYGLATLLCINLCVCTINRSRHLYDRLCQPDLQHKQDKIEKYGNYRQIKVPGVSLEQAAGELRQMFQANRYGVRERKEQGSQLIAASQGKLGNLGSPLLHLAVLLIVAGSVLGGIYGKSVNYQTVAPGGLSLTKNGFPFDLQVQKFSMDYYSNGMPSQYKSKLAVVSGNKILKEKVIQVNDPLVFQGVKVYQSSYGWMIAGEIDDGHNKRSFTVEDGGSVKLAGPGELAMEVHFLPDYQQDSQGRPYSKSMRPSNPKIVYILTSQGQPFSMGTAGLKQLVAVGGTNVYFNSYQNYTGLIVKRDPGVPLVWSGFVLVLIGLVLRFYLKPCYIWARIETCKTGVQIHLASEGWSKLGNQWEQEITTIINRVNLKKTQELQFN